MSLVHRLSHYYKVFALLLLNTFVVFLAINVAFLVVFQVKDRFFQQPEKDPVTEKYGNPVLKEVYPELSTEEIINLLVETWSRPYSDEPFVHFKERPYSGQYVNVDENGFRFTKNQGPWPPEPDYFNIFLFGGSTTFGYGVSDDETIASYLQEFLSHRVEQDIRVYNFGRGDYHSTRELLLMQRLLVSGFVPDVAIFLDGLNDFIHHGVKQAEIEDRVKNKAEEVSLKSEILKVLPVARAARFVNRKVMKPGNGEMNGTKEYMPGVANEAVVNDEVVIQSVIDRYMGNKKLIEAVAAAYSVQAVFIWQPVPMYKYDIEHHLFAEEGFGDFDYSRYGYEKLSELTTQENMGNNFFWCADIQEHLREPLYVDKFHYTPRMSKLLAERIGSFIIDTTTLSLAPENASTTFEGRCG